MAQIINVSGTFLLAGMHWLDPESVKPGVSGASPLFTKLRRVKTGPSSISERDLVAATKATHAAGSTHNAWGYLTTSEKMSLSKVGRFTKVYSLAEMFSSLPALPVCAILVSQLPGDDAFAMCISINGHPAPGQFDVVVPASAVASTLSAWKSQLRRLGSTGEAALYGTWEGVSHELTLDKLVSIAVAPTPVRSIGMGVRQIAVMATVAGVSVIGYLAYAEYQSEQRIKDAQVLAQQHAPGVVYQKALAAQWATQSWGSLERVREIQRKIRQVREFVGGFKISTPVACDVVSGICTFSYKKDSESAATFVDFVKDVRSQFNVISFGQDGRTVECSMTLSGLPLGVVPSIEGLADESQSPLLFWPRIQKLVPTQKVSGTLTNDYKLFPQNLGINEAAVPSTVRTVGVTVTYPLWDLVVIPAGGGVYANAINWKTISAGAGAVTLVGEMYAKKSNS